GRTLGMGEVTKGIAGAANRPVFVTLRSLVGTGAVGGFVLDSIEQGRRAGRLVEALLDTGTLPPSQGDSQSQWVFDAPQLWRWNISELDLPAGSVVLNRQPSLWRQYRWYVVGAVGVITLQALLIGGLLVQRTRRRRAEEAIRTKDAALEASSERIG